MKLFLIFLLSAFMILSCGEDGKNGDNGTIGTNGSLVKLTTEESGTENCNGNGGTKVETGIDVNGDSVLDSEEITSTNFICNSSNGDNGETGETGENGKNSLVSVIAEPTGTENCDGRGGKKIVAGIDDNGDGELQEEEIDTTEFVCNEDGATYYGDFYVAFDTDIEELSNYEVVVGSVYMSFEVKDKETLEPIAELTIPTLRRVTGNIYFGGSIKKVSYNSSIEKISFPDLEQANSLFIRDMEFLTSIDLPKLKELGTRTAVDFKSSYSNMGLSIAYNSNLETLDLSSLKKGYLYIAHNDKLKSVDLTGLTNALASVVDFYDNPVLTTIDFSNLEQISYLYIGDLPEITSIDLSKLKGTPLTYLSFENLPELTSLNLTSLQYAEELYFYGNFSMENISFPKLTDIYNININSTSFKEVSFPELITNSYFYLNNNSELTTVSAPKLLSIGASYGRFEMNNNSKIESISFPELTTLSSQVNIMNNALLKSFDMPKLETAGGSYFNIYNNTSLSECTILDFINSLTTLPYTSGNLTGNKSCKYYKYNTGSTTDYGDYGKFRSFMNGNSWSIAEKMMIPQVSFTYTSNPHMFRGVDGSPLTGDYTITVDVENNTISASVYDGTAWINLSGTNVGIKPKTILSIILNYDSTTMSLYLNGTLIDSKNVSPINDSENEAPFYVAASFNGSEMTNTVPYGFIHNKFIQRSLTTAEISAYTNATSNLIPVTDVAVMEINFMDGASTGDFQGFSSFGSPVQNSVLSVLY